MQSFVCLYGFPAAGKTTFARHFLQEHKDFVGIGADAVRQTLYGSEDHYGDSKEIYAELVRQMTDALRDGKSVLYDGTNLRRQDRLDFLFDLPSIPIHREVIKLPTNMEVCAERHLQRDRDIPLEKILPYFSIGEEPEKKEGWDQISTCCTRAYIASPFFEDAHRAAAVKAAEILRSRGIDTYLPLEHKVPNAWDLPNHEWGAAVYRADVKAIRNSDTVVVLSYGRLGSAGTAWEAGYAFGIGKRVIVVEMPGTTLMSLMVANGRTATVKGLDGLQNYDFIRFPELRDNEMEQK
jgi:nucleoside 2-deoxyribosyltransferase/predicted kinase